MGWMSSVVIEFELLLTTGFSLTQLGVISLSRFTHFTSVHGTYRYDISINLTDLMYLVEAREWAV